MGSAGSSLVSAADLEELQNLFGCNREQLMRIHSQFCSADKTGSAFLCQEEFNSMLGRLGVGTSLLRDRLFRVFDLDGDGSVSVKEFLCGMSVLMRGSPPERLRFGFQLLDLDSDGFITREELLVMVQSIMGVLKHILPTNGQQAESTDRLAQKDAADFVDYFFKRFDRNSDGVISWEEYSEAALENPTVFRALGLSLQTDDTPAQPVQKVSGTENLPRIMFGSGRWNTMMDVMVGIRATVGNIDAQAACTHLLPTHFTDVKVVQLRRSASLHATFKSYAPRVFQQIRRAFGVADRQYILSLGPEQMLGSFMLGTLSTMAEVGSSGKSGSVFFFSNDGRFLVKTISKGEKKSLFKMLRAYTLHVLRQPNTLISRFLGLHTLVEPRHSPMHLVVMNNVFETPREIHLKFDLKGSTVGRTSNLDKSVPLWRTHKVLKDLDLEKPFKLDSKIRKELIKQIHLDCAFLVSVGVMDYSLLVGIHHTYDPPEGVDPHHRTPLASPRPSDASASADMSTDTLSSLSPPASPRTAKSSVSLSLPRKLQALLPTQQAGRARKSGSTIVPASTATSPPPAFGSLPTSATAPPASLRAQQSSPSLQRPPSTGQSSSCSLKVSSARARATSSVDSVALTGTSSCEGRARSSASALTGSAPHPEACPSCGDFPCTCSSPHKGIQSLKSLHCFSNMKLNEFKNIALNHTGVDNVYDLAPLRTAQSNTAPSDIPVHVGDSGAVMGNDVVVVVEEKKRKKSISPRLELPLLQPPTPCSSEPFVSSGSPAVRPRSNSYSRVLDLSKASQNNNVDEDSPLTARDSEKPKSPRFLLLDTIKRKRRPGKGSPNATVGRAYERARNAQDTSHKRHSHTRAKSSVDPHDLIDLVETDSVEDIDEKGIQEGVVDLLPLKNREPSLFYRESGGIMGTDNELYFFGIIDILVEYSLKKQAEHKLRSTIHGKGVSAVPPDMYSLRFQHFMKDVIAE